MDYESIRLQSKNAVLARPFTRIAGKPTYEQKEAFLEEAEDLAMTFTVSYPWTGEHGLLTKVMGAQKYLAKTTKVYVPPVCPPVYDPRIVGHNLTQVEVRIAQALNDTTKVNYAVVEGFREGFGENYRKAFDKNYYEQLWEETFKYKRVLPIDYITHLETQHVVLDTLVIARLRKETLRDWGDEHISPFATRLDREQRKLAALTPPITITDKGKLQKFLEEM